MPERRFDVLLALGSNIEPEVHVPDALARLRASLGVVSVSAAVVGPAVGGGAADPPFTNLAVRIRTDLPYRALHARCRSIEADCGRRRTADRYAPRTMDIDIVFGDPAFSATSGGRVPAADLLSHGFLLGPAAEVWPDAVHPGTGKTLSAHWASP